jgi:hypothetical protein
MKKISFLVILAVISLTANAQTALRLNLQKGKTYTQTADVKINMKMETQGMKMSFDVPMSMTVSMKVTDIQNDNYVIECTYDALKMTMNMMGQKIAFNSSDKKLDPNNPFSQLFSSFINKPFTMILDKRQNIIAVEGFDKLFASLLENDAYTEEQKTEMNKMLQGIFGEDKWKETFASGNMIFPQEPVFEGFTWENKTSKNVHGMNMQAKNIYKVEKITAKTAEISVVSHLNMNMTAANENETKVKVTVESAQSNSLYVIDLKSGWTKTAKSNTAMKMLTSTNEGDKEISIPMQITMEMTIK